MRVDHLRGAGFLGSTPLITYAFDSSTAWLKKRQRETVARQDFFLKYFKYFKPRLFVKEYSVLPGPEDFTKIQRIAVANFIVPGWRI